MPASPDPAGYVASVPIELSHVDRQRPPAARQDGRQRRRRQHPRPDGRARATAPAPDVHPGADHYLTFKGVDTRLSACLYYRALGAVEDCDAQGNPSGAISFSDWKTQERLRHRPADVAADFINQRDLNLLRRMVATRSASGGIAFYVCNAPGPDGKSQTEIDRVIEEGMDDKNKVACVAMEYTPVTGANGGQPFTKFFTFGPDETLLLSINLDGRGEKFMPGSCVACHGGTTYNGRFPEQATASPFLGARFLPFDTGNYLFSSKSSLSEASQSEAFFQLNQLVLATEIDPNSATSRLINGWYANGHVLDKEYVPPIWQLADAQPATAGAARFYKEVVGISCRTCHVSLGAQFDWDDIILTPGAGQHPVLRRHSQRRHQRRRCRMR